MAPQPFQISHIDPINKLPWSSGTLFIQSYPFPTQYQDIGYSTASFPIAQKNSITKKLPIVKL